LSRCVIGSIPSITASDGSGAGPDAEHRAPVAQVIERDDSLRNIKRMMKYGTEITPVPSLIRLVRSAARRGTSQASRSFPSAE